MTDKISGEDKTFVLVAVVVATAILTLVAIVGWIAVRVTEADRESRNARIEACTLTEDPELRIICINGDG